MKVQSAGGAEEEREPRGIWTGCAVPPPREGLENMLARELPGVKRRDNGAEC